MFDPLEDFQSTHLGMFRETIKAEYPSFEEKPFLLPKTEYYKPNLGKSAEPVVIKANSLPRLWFVSENKNQILQLQSDQLINNWKKVQDEDSYPHYDEIIQKFENHFNEFNAFVNDHEIGEIKPKQYELTYVNHISSLNGWEKDSPIENIFPEFKLASDPKNFLPKCEAFNWTNTYLLPNEEGRLYSTIKVVLHRVSAEPLIRFQLKVTGINKEASLDKMRSWFDLAHEWILLSFAELTNEKVQTEYWGRTQ
ncbi:MAG: TIGR04255 family protein [Nitrospina sp.]|jgi:uncharacterized protein (TIGR04255 family)|nr:TIGR04255 family protein [Nitrospina sp.]MBT6739553.1 TIGR04255 family protein [Nitrospina sp.]MBT7476940.1 TIGR04255 family protein [Nitrospina sp.]